MVFRQVIEVNLTGAAYYTYNALPQVQATQRRRELVMRLGTLGCWLKLLAPRLLDKIMMSSFMRPSLQRTQEESI